MAVLSGHSHQCFRLYQLYRYKGRTWTFEVLITDSIFSIVRYFSLCDMVKFCSFPARCAIFKPQIVTFFYPLKVNYYQNIDNSLLYLCLCIPYLLAGVLLYKKVFLLKIFKFIQFQLISFSFSKKCNLSILYAMEVESRGFWESFKGVFYKRRLLKMVEPLD